jgi:hypothetical protein
MKACNYPLIMFFSLFLAYFPAAWGQVATQTVRGLVLDKQSELPLIGAAVELEGVEPRLGAITDAEGRFTMRGVPVGRQNFRVTYLGYNPLVLPNVIVTAGKETILDIALEESVVSIDEVVVRARADKDRANNDMAAVSARTFNPEEVNRFSGGRNDVARLAGNFAGVAVADDSRNDLVIRGNSPTGVLWRLEGIPIPNPNHFSTLGTTGGPVSAINPNFLRSSDFLTSAFPAEYGNALAGAFDLNWRGGNRERHEFTAQLAAFSGLEAMAEGPLSSKRDGSYLVAYRHSFVQIANELGIPIGTNATPNYRDLSFKVDFANGKAGKFSLFGIGASSNINFFGAETDENDLFADPNADSYVTSRMGVVGLRHNILVGQDAYLRTVVSASTAGNTFRQDELLDDGGKRAITDVDDVTNTFSLSSYWNKKYSARFTLRAGILAQYFLLNTRVDDRDGREVWVTVRDFDGGMGLHQYFAQGQYKAGQRLIVNAGVHAQYLDFNGSFALEPRLAFNWQTAPNQTLNLGYGLHHQMQPLPIFFFQEEIAPGLTVPTNENLGFTRSNHFVLGYDWRLGADWRLKAESYYQYIDRVPVESFPSTFSLLNAGADFVFPEAGSLVNEGRGRNYGFELTLEKFFSKGYYTLFTTSLFESKYRSSDGVWRNTAFNNGYIVNFLAGKEFLLGKTKRNALTFDTKVTAAGGRYYTPVDLEASRQAGREILDEANAFSQRFDPYFRLDVKFGYRLNSKSKRFSQQFFLDFQNITDNKNIFALRYNELTNQVNPVYQSGFFPDLLWRVQF